MKNRKSSLFWFQPAHGAALISFQLCLLLSVAITGCSGQFGKEDSEYWRYTWIGTAPGCSGKKSDCTDRKMSFVRFDKYGDGGGCTSGRKVLCKKKHTGTPTPRQVWIGNAPFCSGSKEDCKSLDYETYGFDEYGDGGRCRTGKKVLCVTHPGKSLRKTWIGTKPVCDGRASDCESLDLKYIRRESCLRNHKVLCEERPITVPDEDSPNRSISVMTWNIFSRPFLVTHDGQMERMYHIPRHILRFRDSTPEVIVFQEAFMSDGTHDDPESGIHTRFLRLLGRAGIGHTTERPTSIRSIANGGVFIASKWPIVKVRYGVFDDHSGNDSFAAKGWVYARIVKKGGDDSRTFHIFGTHMQGGYSRKHEDIRIKQARQIRKAIDDMKIPESEPVIIAGDLNADLENNRRHARRIFSELNATMPRWRTRRKTTSDPETNQLVGSDGAAAAGGCEEEYLKTKKCTCCRKELLDFVLYDNKHRRPEFSYTGIVTPTAETPFNVCMSGPVQPWRVEPRSKLCKRMWEIKDLSDHYPAISNFIFTRR